MSILTKDDLAVFRSLLLTDFKTLLETNKGVQREWFQSFEIRKMLNISAGTLQTWRNNGTLPHSKMGSLFFYKINDLNSLLSANTNTSRDRRYKKQAVKPGKQV